MMKLSHLSHLIRQSCHNILEEEGNESRILGIYQHPKNHGVREAEFRFRDRNQHRVRDGGSGDLFTFTNYSP